MKSSAWNVLSLAAGALAAIGTRKILSAAWPGSVEPPLNPADRRIAWGDAIAWAVASGIGAGVSRLVSKRLAAAGWEWATGESPPDLRTS